MRGWTVEQLGAPSDVLSLAELAMPTPAAGQVLVRVTLAPMNFPDDLMIRGQYQVKPTLPFTPGLEVLGTVVERGAGVRLPLGARGVGLTAFPGGGLAEHALVDEADFFEVPDDIPDPAAASMLITYQTSHVALHRRASLRAEEVLLVHAGAGGVGSAAIELGVAAGATVIATAGTDDKVELCRRIGATTAVNYRTDDFVSVVKDTTAGRGADVIYDPVGGDVFDQSRRCIAWEGRLLIIGFAGGRIAELATNHALLKNYSVVGVHWGAYRQHDREIMRSAHDDLVRLHREGRIHPLVDEIVPLERVREALDRLVGRATVGKLLVAP